MTKTSIPILVVVCLLTIAAARDYYDVLHVHKSADEATIKRAYRKLALKLHPDKVQGSEEEKQKAAEKFAEVGHAYEVLTDPEKRRIYDQHGEEGLKSMGQGGHAHGGHAAHDIFAQFFGFGFGGAGGGGEDQTPRGDTVYAVLEVTLKDAYLGNSFRVTRDKGIYHEAPGTRECKCKQKVVTQQLGHGMFQQYTTRSCEQCPNMKLVRQTDTLTVSVEPGMQDGQEIQVFEEGEPVLDGEPGDLIFVVRILPHAYFTRTGDDLHMVTTISLLEALVGFKKKIKHVDGHMVETVSTEVTRHGQVVKIDGEGMPRYEKEGRGDLYIKYNVAFPSNISSSQAKTLKQMFSDASWNVHEEL